MAAINYTKNLTADEVAILENDLLDVAVWIDGLIAGKLNNTTIRLAKQRKQQLIRDGATTVPATDAFLAADAIADVGYKTRAQREAEQV